MRDLLPRIDAFIVAVRLEHEILDRTKLRLAHKDLHFVNIMYDLATNQITGILDWEFSSVVAFHQWN